MRGGGDVRAQDQDDNNNPDDDGELVGGAFPASRRPDAGGSDGQGPCRGGRERMAGRGREDLKENDGEGEGRIGAWQGAGEGIFGGEALSRDRRRVMEQG